jgi:hypothetical protein
MKLQYRVYHGQQLGSMLNKLNLIHVQTETLNFSDEELKH